MTPDDAGTSARDQRRVRLAAALRENLKRRKAQQRSRAAGLASAGVEAGAQAGAVVAATPEDAADR
jgi:hypothetical protein